MAKPKVAFFDFACCEGCQLCALDITPEQLHDLLQVVDIVEFREAMSEKDTEYDIAIIEGSITRPSDIPRLQDIRDRSSFLIAFGTCAHIAGFNALKNFQKKEEYQNAVYPDAPEKFETDTAKAVGEIVHIDGFIPGCPIDTGEFVRVVKNLVLGKKPAIPDYPLCTECKNNENICVYEKGMHCLGPITRAGCNSRCINSGGYCFGCRGLVSEPNVDSLKEILQKYNLSYDEAMDKFKLCLQRSREVFSDGK